MKLLFAAALVAAPTLATAEPLDLICRGTLKATESVSTWGKVTNDPNEIRYGYSNRNERVQTSETMRVRIDETGTTGAIKRSWKGSDWADFIELSVTDDMIEGRISLGRFTKPKVRIDRRTGDAEYKIDDTRFFGSCERAPAETERKF